jgi:ferredoxin
MNVSADPARCQGHARCNAICPEVFDLDQDGFVVVLNPSPGDELAVAVNDAAANCPEQAISAG